MNQPAENVLIEKIKGLRPERIAEVEDFVDFLKARDEERGLTLAAGSLAEESLRRSGTTRTTPTMTGCEFGDIVLVPFPFTDQSASKRRPAVVVSSQAYHRARIDLIVMPITSQVRSATAFGEVLVQDWKAAGLLKPGVVKPVITTIERSLVLRKLGRLNDSTQDAIRKAIAQSVG